MPAHKIKVKTLDSENLRRKLKLKSLELRSTILDKYPHVNNYFLEKNLDISKIREHSAKLLGTGLITGSLFLLPPGDEVKFLSSPHEIILKLKDDKSLTLSDEKGILVNILKSVLPEKPRPLLRSEEKFLEQIFKNFYNISAKASLEGEHLNTTYGFIGIEQHLRRYPKDKLSYHGEGKVLREGLAPGLSAWGYFAPSKDEMDEYLENVERWYAVVQTLYLPDWSKRQPYLKNWYKYRKVIIVNVDNGRAVVAAIADSGPAAWTGKQFGASPEVMISLGGDDYKKGRVLLFFVDDPENEVPLGPVEAEKKLSSVISY